MKIPECKGCGKCCIWVIFQDIPERKPCKSNPDGYRLFYGRCEFLNENNECEIYGTDKWKRLACETLIRGSEGCIEFLQSHKNK